MNLTLPSALGESYKSNSQIARVVTEEWGARNLYCPACDSNRVMRAPTNTRAVDFICPECRQPYQLKSSRNWNENRVVDAGYRAMITAIRSESIPNLFVLQYSPSWLVKNILLVPYFFVTESAIEKRKPLGQSARRKGWVGCNILLREIPLDGKLRMVSNGIVTDAGEIRRQFHRIKPLADLNVQLRGWTLDVLKVIRRLNKPDFALSDVYRYDTDLAAMHPSNRNVRPKIRQQLQVLRDLGFINFTDRGHYSLS
jgi:type II restriction enzyme